MKEQVDERDRSQAMEILLTLRRRLVDSATRSILAQRNELLTTSETGDSGLKLDGESEAAIAGLSRLEPLIAALRACETSNQDQPEADATPRRPTSPVGDRVFERFAALVSAVKLEEASRELSRIFQMPIDRAGTATRFFARAVRAKPALIDELPTLCRRLLDAPSSQGIRLLMAVFGFQAVESRMAMEALNARHRQLVAV